MLSTLHCHTIARDSGNAASNSSGWSVPTTYNTLIKQSSLNLVHSAANLAHWEFLTFALGSAYYTQIMGGASTIPTTDESYLMLLEQCAMPEFLNYVLIGDRTSAILTGTNTLPEHGSLIQFTLPLPSYGSLAQMQAICCEAMLCFIFERPDPLLLDRLLACEGKTRGNLTSAYWPFSLARLIYELASLDKLPDATVNLAIADKAVESLRRFIPSTSANDYPNFGRLADS